jgi:hypothetical protein
VVSCATSVAGQPESRAAHAIYIHAVTCRGVFTGLREVSALFPRRRRRQQRLQLASGPGKTLQLGRASERSVEAAEINVLAARNNQLCAGYPATPSPPEAAQRAFSSTPVSLNVTPGQGAGVPGSDRALTSRRTEPQSAALPWRSPGPGRLTGARASGAHARAAGPDSDTGQRLRRHRSGHAVRLLRRDPRSASCPRGRGPVRHASTGPTAVREDPARGMCGRSQYRSALRKYSGQAAAAKPAASRPGRRDREGTLIIARRRRLYELGPLG